MFLSFYHCFRGLFSSSSWFVVSFLLFRPNPSVADVAPSAQAMQVFGIPFGGSLRPRVRSFSLLAVCAASSKAAAFPAGRPGCPCLASRSLTLTLSVARYKMTRANTTHTCRSRRLQNDLTVNVVPAATAAAARWIGESLHPSHF